MTGSLRLHASAVAVDGRGILIRGASGSGKSSLALQLMGLGATLISDDQTELTENAGGVRLSAPATIKGQVEARGLGILNADSVTAPLHLVVDLDVVETQRLPVRHQALILNTAFPCIHKVDTPAWPFAVLQYVKGGRSDTE
ncbi:HPr kinase/phosphatase C-terminal domain-containing protein [Tateyamaria omphalii]|uniref:HPr kinase/phosphorylase n=1 Tax=Tateyamaria omphalii TaxID=299262 RepID=UPI001C99E0B6|nr:HPr kinase/phosphatase C-terminal domain-containing protein [Tateyamaria omphalii]MBY5934492.1 HPr kinase/phosphatase C-terminal domain-containing protein [Tateyamaria omphalii]